jgi:hypothetical protein
MLFVCCNLHYVILTSLTNLFSVWRQSHEFSLYYNRFSIMIMIAFSGANVASCNAILFQFVELILNYFPSSFLIPFFQRCNFSSCCCTLSYRCPYLWRPNLFYRLQLFICIIGTVYLVLFQFVINYLDYYNSENVTLK